MKISDVGAIAIESILYEVAATPKPGLVDRNNSGAHNDMDFFSFMSSAAALRNYFDNCAEIGAQHSSESAKNFLRHLKPLGIAAENNMFKMTGGVNTHKGIIFSLGILSAITGFLIERNENFSADKISELSSEICSGLCKNHFENLHKKNNLTKGEAMYLKYGAAGIRGEVESGFSTVIKISLPIYQRLRESKISVNDALIDTLIHLMAVTVDTNILSRHDMKTLQYVQSESKKVIQLGSINTFEGRQAIFALDDDFIKRWISPGGSADLLAATHFLYRLIVQS